MTKVQFCPLLELEKDGAVANLLRIDTVTVLLDCGWTQAFDPALLQPIIEILSEVTIILISHPTLEYVGALPYLAKQPGFHASIYATLPVARMSQMVLYDAYLSRAKYERFSTLTIEGINSTFELVNQLKYSEKFPVKGREYVEEGILVTPNRAGHTVGGTLWKLTYDMQDIIYAPCVNPHPQRHISGLDFDTCEQALLLILDTSCCNERRRADEERRFLENIKETVGRTGSVLIPVHAAGPTLEILVTLDEFWDSNRDDLQSAGLYFLGNMSKTTIDFIKSHLEWMNERAISQFEISRDNLFTFKYVKLVQSMEEVDWSRPCCVLATPIDLSCPLSRTALVRLAEDENNLLLIPETPTGSGFLKSVLEAPKGSFFEFRSSRLIFPEASTADVTSVSDEMQVESTITVDQPPTNEPVDSYVKHFETKVFPCFSICECKALADEYGEVLSEFEQNIWKAANDMEEAKEKLSEQALKQQLQTPVIQMIEEERLRRSATSEEVTVSFKLLMRKCVCLMDSRPDLGSLKLTIAKARPKQLALLNGFGKQEIGEYAKTHAGVREVYYAQSGAIVNLLQHFTIRSIHFSEELYLTLKFHTVDGYEVSFIKGEVQDTEGRLVFHIQDSAKPAQEYGLFLGSLNMTQLKIALMEKGYRVLFRDGKLVVNDTVLLSKAEGDGGKTNYLLEGQACKEYYELRKMLYSNFIYL